MRIVIDARAYSWAGIGRYIRELVDWLELRGRHKYILLLSAAGKKMYKGQLETILVDGKYYSWREQTVFWAQLRNIKADIFHFTHFNVPYFFRGPMVVTVHDVTRFIFPGQKRQDLWQQMAYEMLFRRTVLRAKQIICVSESTASELNQLPFGVDIDRLTVIPEGVQKKFFKSVGALEKTKVRMLLDITDPYLLYVGVWMAHKNLDRLLQAFCLVLKTWPNLKLVMTGRPVPGYLNLLDQVKVLGIQDNVIFPGFVPENLLVSLYSQARAFVFPSSYEGFGLPILEAAACKTPVVVSQVSSLPEILGSNAFYCNPDSVVSIKAAIEKVLNISESELLTIIERAQRRAYSFDWVKSGEAHELVYEQMNDLAVKS